MNEEIIIAQIGLMLTQLRVTRRAVEDIERSTARYGGFSFTSALAAGPRFGEPPLFQGALRVHVININDLAPGSGFGGFLEGLLGGIGRFFGGLIGGVIGGTIGGVTVGWIIANLTTLATSIDRILDRLGMRGTGSSAATPAPAGTGVAETVQQQAQRRATEGAGTDWRSLLADLRSTANAFTGLFQSAQGQADQAGRTSPLPTTPAGQRWLAILESVNTLLSGIRVVVDGLILLLPIVIGALAMLIARFETIKLALVDLLGFVFRNAFLLRGVVLTVVFDTLASAARLAAGILTILGSAVERILTAIFNMIGSLLNAAIEVIRFLAAGIQRTVDAVLRWLGDTLFNILTRLGDTRIFRVIVHVLNILPAVLPPVFELIRGVPMSGADRTALTTAAAAGVAGPSFTGPPSSVITPFPNIASTLLPSSAVGGLSTIVSDALTGVTGEVGDIFSAGRDALAGVSRTLSGAATSGDFNARLEQRLGTVRARSQTLADALQPAQRPAQPTGLEAIATAYEQWLSGNGLSTLLAQITEHFRREPTIPRRAAGTLDAPIRPRATVEIDDVTIEITPPPAAAEPPSPPPRSELEQAPRGGRLSMARLLELFHEMEERGVLVGPGAAFPQVPT